MRQSAFIGFIGFLALIIIIGIAGCGGGSSSTPTTTSPSITVSPATLSLNFGQVVQLTPTMLDANGKQVFTPTPVYSSSDANITVSTGGLVCAGKWDSLTTPIVCSTTDSAGKLLPYPTTSINITVTAGTLTATVPTSVHSRIARVTVTGSAACTSQTATQQFTAHAFDSNNVDITASAGTFTFASGNTSVATVDAATGLATSVMPGSTTISASVNNIFSLPATFVACPPASIVLSPATFSGAAGASQQLTATVTDTNGNAITGAALTYSSSQPVVASVSSAGLISAIAAGSTGIIASCTPPTCNPGANIPVYSNLVSTSVTGTSATTVYVTGVNATSVVPIDTATNVAGTAITIPQINSLQPVIKSIAFDKLGSKLYIGTDLGLLVLDVATNTIGTPISVGGNVLAVSPDGKKVIVADQTPAAPQTFIVDTTNSSAFSLGISTISTAANFSPDSLKAYIVSSSSPTLTVYSPSFPTKVLTINAPANDVTFLTQGSLGYLAGGTANSVTARSTCDNNALTNPVATTATPLRIASSFDSTRVFAIDGSRMYDVTVSNIATAPSTNCPVTATNSLNTVSFGNTFTPVQLIVTSDASRAFVTNNLNKLMVYNSTNSTASTITLSNGATSSTTGGATLDNLQLYVGALGSNDVHRIDVAAGTDAQQIAVGLKDSAGAATSPDFVAVRPK